MANQEHFEQLQRGVVAWNEWRSETAVTVQPDLSGVSLSNWVLSEANLQGAKLSNTDFRGANLARANLRGANLRGANLGDANLFEAYLTGGDCSAAHLERAHLNKTDCSEANFEGAYLNGVHLVKARLSRANFRTAKLRGANLGSAYCDKTNFTEADLRNAIFDGAQCYRANLSDAHLGEASCIKTNFSEAILYAVQMEAAILDKAILRFADLKRANLSKATLRAADLNGADLKWSNFTGSILEDANLQNSDLIETNFERAILTGCRIYGISVWSLKGTPAEQANLIITRSDEAKVTVDDLQVAQFIYLLLNRAALRNVINTITSKAVLILGRFTPERKVILDALAVELRKYNLLPIIFDFERPNDKDFTETIKTLAALSLFVIADITNPKSAPLELQATVPDYQIPFIPIIQQGEKPFSMFSDLLGKYNWVLAPVEYPSVDTLLLVFKQAIIDRAWAKHQELEGKKAERTKVLSADDFLKKGE